MANVVVEDIVGCVPGWMVCWTARPARRRIHVAEDTEAVIGLVGPSAVGAEESADSQRLELRSNTLEGSVPVAKHEFDVVLDASASKDTPQLVVRPLEAAAMLLIPSLGGGVVEMASEDSGRLELEVVFERDSYNGNGRMPG